MNPVQQRVLIFSGGTLGPWALAYIQPEDFLIGADQGASFLLKHGHKPNLSVGDFDSVSAEQLTIIQQCSQHFLSCDAIDKDLTDTELALQHALSRQPREILMLGVLGSRLDHSLANVHLLRQALDASVPCRIVDPHNEVRLIDQSMEITKSRFTHVSLLPLTEKVTGVTLSGFQYPLDKATLTIGQTLAISNVLTAERGLIHIDSGLLLVICSLD
jgi:thiamine pyrophosphokinase